MPDPKDMSGYKGNPHDFDPHRSSRYDLYTRRPDSGGPVHPTMQAPPPAHSHQASDMKNPRRPDSRNKSPSVYPDPRSSSSPYMDPAARHSPATPRIPPPPPLITSSGGGGVGGPPPKTPPKMGGRSPPPPSALQHGAGLMPGPPGSITHGTPVSQPAQGPPMPPQQSQRRMEMPPHPMAPSSTSTPTSAGGRMEGSITKGTPMQGRGIEPALLGGGKLTSYNFKQELQKKIF
jgi:hypothetical protein